MLVHRQERQDQNISFHKFTFATNKSIDIHLSLILSLMQTGGGQMLYPGCIGDLYFSFHYSLNTSIQANTLSYKLSAHSSLFSKHIKVSQNANSFTRIFQRL